MYINVPWQFKIGIIQWFPQINYYKRRHCIILYVGHFWPPHFGPISVESLIYTPISLFFTPRSFFCLLPFVLYVCVPGVRVQYVNEGRG